MSSMTPPYTLAPTNTGSSPIRPVRASGKASTAKAMKCTSLSLPSGAGGAAYRGQSIAIVRVSITAMVRRMSRFLGIRRCVYTQSLDGKCGFLADRFTARSKATLDQRLGGSDKVRYCASAHFLSFLNFICLINRYMLSPKRYEKHDQA